MSVLASPSSIELDGDTVAVEAAVADIQQGRMVLVTDDESRENEADLVMAAEKATPEAINFMTTFGRGLVCVAMTPERLEGLRLPQMVDANSSNFGTAFTVSVDLKEEGRTGISAFDRAATIRALCDETTAPEQLARPGHVFPLRADPGTVLARQGHTEASVDLARLAGLYPAGVICEVLGPDGSMATGAGLRLLAAQHGLRILSIPQLVRYRLARQVEVRRTATSRLPTPHGTFDLLVYDATRGGECVVALVLGSPSADQTVLTRIHSQCLTGDVFGSTRCDCGEQLKLAMAAISRQGTGILLYLTHQEGRGIGLRNKVRAYALQDGGLDTVDANTALGLPVDARDYGCATAVLADLGITRVRLLTNNPAKQAAVERAGIEVAERVSVVASPGADNARYLRTKQSRLGHLFDRPMSRRLHPHGTT